MFLSPWRDQASACVKPFLQPTLAVFPGCSNGGIPDSNRQSRVGNQCKGHHYHLANRNHPFHGCKGTTTRNHPSLFVGEGCPSRHNPTPTSACFPPPLLLRRNEAVFANKHVGVNFKRHAIWRGPKFGSLPYQRLEHETIRKSSPAQVVDGPSKDGDVVQPHQKGADRGSQACGSSLMACFAPLQCNLPDPKQSSYKINVGSLSTESGTLLNPHTRRCS